MSRADQLVAAVAWGLGALHLTAAVLNVERFFGLPKLRWLDRRLGRSATRLVVAGVGLLLITLGVVVWQGLRPSFV